MHVYFAHTTTLHDKDLTQVRRMDTAGAFAVIRAVGPDFSLDQVEARPESKRLLELVDNAVRVKPIERPQPRGFHELTIRIGKGVVDLVSEFLDTMAFLGHLLVTIARTVGYLFVSPKRIRWAAIVSLMERAGLDAKQLALRGAEAVLKMILVDGFFQADPHPGNVIYLPGNRLAIIDVGMVGRLSTMRRNQIIDVVSGIAHRDHEPILEVFLDWAGEDPVDEIPAHVED